MWMGATVMAGTASRAEPLRAMSTKAGAKRRYTKKFGKTKKGPDATVSTAVKTADYKARFGAISPPSHR